MSGAVDAAALERIRALDPDGTSGLLARVLTSYVGSLESDVAGIGAALAAGALEDAVGGAHKLKSPSTSVGAQQVAELAEAIETAAKASDERELERLLPLLEAEARRALLELRVVLEGTEGGA